MAQIIAIPAGIFQMVGHFSPVFFFYIAESVEKGKRRIALGTGGQVEGGLCEVETSFGKANSVEGGSAG